MAFATVDELESYIGTAIPIAKVSTAELLLDLATAAVQNEAGQRIEQVTDDEVQLAGSWEAMLDLPEKPVTAVASALIALDGIGPGVATAFTLMPGGRLLWGNQALAPLLVDDPDGGHWGGPKSIVTVTYDHGFEAGHPTYLLAKIVCISAASRAFINPEGLDTENISTGYAVSYGAAKGLALSADEAAMIRRRFGRPMGSMST